MTHGRAFGSSCSATPPRPSRCRHRRPHLAAPRETPRDAAAASPTAALIKYRPRKQRVLGIYRASEGGGGRLEPIDKKQLGRELVDPARRQAATPTTAIWSRRSGARAERFGLPTARGDARGWLLKTERAVSLIAIHAHGIPNGFPPPRCEAEARRAADLDGREDWRDAAAHHHRSGRRQGPRRRRARRTRSTTPNNPGGFVLTRGHRRRRPLRPPGLGARPRSAGCAAIRSISPTASCRCCRSASPTICARCARARTARRSRCAWSSAPTAASAATTSFACMMRSAAKLSYEQAQAAIDGRAGREYRAAARSRAQAALGRLCGAEARPRRARAARPRPAGAQDRARRRRAPSIASIAPERLDAHRLIEEFMILANVSAAETLERSAHAADLPRPRRALAGEDRRRCASSWRRSGSSCRRAARCGPSSSTACSHSVKGTRRRAARQRGGAAHARRRPNTRPRTSAISASTCAATPISPRRSAAMPI